MRARAVNTSLDTDSLQADVMRFMAIIAFCLIAILALVRNIDAPAVATPPLAPLLPAPVAPVPAVAASTVPAVADLELELESESESEALLEPMLEPVPTQMPPVVPRSLPLPTPTIVTAEPPANPAVQPAAESAPVGADEAGLSLRFATEQDFLRLIARRDVQVYLFKPGAVQQLGSNYRFQPAAAPGELFEMLPSTIPELVRNSAAQAVGAMADYRFGVKFPARIERRIASLVDSVDSGELLIDRFGQVTYAADGAERRE